MVLGDDGFAAEEAAVLGDVVDFVAEAAVLGDFAVLLLALADVEVDFNVEVVPRADVFDAIGMSRCGRAQRCVRVASEKMARSATQTQAGADERGSSPRCGETSCDLFLLTGVNDGAASGVACADDAVSQRQGHPAEQSGTGRAPATLLLRRLSDMLPHGVCT